MFVYWGPFKVIAELKTYINSYEIFYKTARVLRQPATIRVVRYLRDFIRITPPVFSYTHIVQYTNGKERKMVHTRTYARTCTI